MGYDHESGEIWIHGVEFAVVWYAFMDYSIPFLVVEELCGSADINLVSPYMSNFQILVNILVFFNVDYAPTVMYDALVDTL